MPDIMLDMETLATSPDAVILTFGAVKFNPKSSEEPETPYYARIEVEEQTALGRVINDDTLAWWGKQEASIFEDTFSDEDRVGLEQFTTELNRYVVGANKIWCQGPTFDITMLENLYKMLGKPVPWQYWQIRDSRTLGDLTTIKRNHTKETAHNALADAFIQAVTVQEIFNELGLANDA